MTPLEKLKDKSIPLLKRVEDCLKQLYIVDLHEFQEMDKKLQAIFDKVLKINSMEMYEEMHPPTRAMKIIMEIERRGSHRLADEVICVITTTFENLGIK